MTEDDLIGVAVLVGLAVAIGASIWIVARRRARASLSDEIARGHRDEAAMSRAFVDAGGDAAKARRRYVHDRLRTHRRSWGRSIAGTALRRAWLVFALYMVGMGAWNVGSQLFAWLS